MRGATRKPGCLNRNHTSFNPRPSCEGRHYEVEDILAFVAFQSAPLMCAATIKTTP